MRLVLFIQSRILLCNNGATFHHLLHTQIDFCIINSFLPTFLMVIWSWKVYCLLPAACFLKNDDDWAPFSHLLFYTLIGKSSAMFSDGKSNCFFRSKCVWFVLIGFFVDCVCISAVSIILLEFQKKKFTDADRDHLFLCKHHTSTCALINENVF